MSTSILFVDDDVELASMLADYVREEGYAVTTVHEGEHGVAEALSGRHALVVLDMMMPGINGIEVLRRIRLQSSLPVLMLTARGDDIDKVVGLEMGADDYVPKPCTPRELVARIRAILRRAGAALPSQPPAADAPFAVGQSATAADPTITAEPAPPTLQIDERFQAGPLTLWPARRRALWHGEPLTLTSTQFNLLEALIRQRGQVVSKAELSEKALGRKLGRFDRSIDVHVSSLRQKLVQPAGSPASPTGEASAIATVRGQGYQWVL